MGHEQKVGVGAPAPLMPGAALAGGIGVGKQTQIQSLGPQGAPVQAKAGPTPSPATAAPAAEQAGGTQTDVADGSRGQLSELLATPARPLGDPVVMYLLGLPLPIMLDELADAARCGYFLQLETRLAAAPPVLFAALQSARLSLYTSLTPAHPALQRTGDALDKVSTEQQVAILGWMLAQKGIHLMATTLVEGAVAIRGGQQGKGAAAEHEEGAGNGAGAEHEEGAGDGAGAEHEEGAGDGAGAAVGAQRAGGMPAPIEPGKWKPPGAMPGGYYVGTAVHTAIARHYESKHRGQLIATNTMPVGTILKRFKEMAIGGDAAALTESDLKLRPDILNLTLKHVYEIKPEKARAQAHAKLASYRSALGKGGLAVELGPTEDPGVRGQLPAPAGTIMFSCTEPGVITYDYRRSRLVPVPVAAPAKKRSREWKWAFEKDLTPEQRSAMVTTGIGGAVLILLMVVLAPAGA